MPEVLAKFPDVVLQVLREAGVECGTGVAQKILVKCLPERFCSLPSGEICVYGLEDIGRMTQISAVDFLAAASLQFNVLIFISLVSAFILGYLLGRYLKRRR